MTAVVAFRYLLPALVLESGYVALLLVGAIQHHIVETITILIGSTAVYIICLAGFLKESQSRGAGWILVPALVFRFTLLPLWPGFTDDLYRYRWEARLQQEVGGNPYAVAPSDPQVAELRDATYPRISGPTFRAVYGPFTEITYRWAYSIARALGGADAFAEVFWMKLPGVLFELGTLVGVWALVRARGLPAWRLALYAWAPLPVFEFWANGHNDSLMLCALVWAFWAVDTKRWKQAFLLLGTAVAAKVWPLVLAPAFVGFRRWRYLPWLVVPVIAAMLPYREGLLSNLPFLSGFLGGWRNNDSLYGLLLAASGDQYTAKYLAFALLGGLAAILWLRRVPVLESAIWLIPGMLLISANCHPWYLTWFLILLPVFPNAGLLLWTALMPLSYAVLIGWETAGVWNGSTPTRWFVYLPVWGLWVIQLLRWRVSKSTSGRIG